jgi:hypothetical protein
MNAVVCYSPKVKETPNDHEVVIYSCDEPHCWKNFIQSCDLYDRIREIHEGLKTYNAVLTPQHSMMPRKIIFNTAADKTWFLLRWG